MSPEGQLALLRVLKEGKFERLGSAQIISVDVRVIVATNRDLQAPIQPVRSVPISIFYYRLNVFPIQVPPLRERREDIPELVQHFLRTFAIKHGKHRLGITSHDLALLVEYDWPGNIRELRNVIERAVIASSEKQLTLDAAALLTEITLAYHPMGLLRNERDKLARMMIEKALSEHGGKN